MLCITQSLDAVTGTNRMEHRKNAFVCPLNLHAFIIYCVHACISEKINYFNNDSSAVLTNTGFM